MSPTPGPQGLDQGYSAHSMRATFIYASYQSHSLNHLTGIAIAPPGGGSGNIYTGLYIVDSANNVIKLLQDWSHTLVTVAGNRMAGYVDGSISQAEFHAPTVIGSVSVGE